ncbi:MAG: hypothetical protein QM630_05195 [Microbacterium sp.]
MTSSKHMHRVLPRFTAGLLWGLGQFAADPALQRGVASRGRLDGVELAVSPLRSAAGVDIEVTMARRVVFIRAKLNAYDRPPEDRALDGVSLVTRAYLAAVTADRIPTSPALEVLADKALAESVGEGIPGPRLWVPRVLHVRVPATKYLPYWHLPFIENIEQTSGDAEIQCDGESGYEAVDQDWGRWSEQLYTVGPDALVDALISATAAAAGAPPEFEIVKDDWAGSRLSSGRAGGNPTTQNATQPSAPDVIIEIHVPILGGDVGWIDEAEEFLAGIDESTLVYDDGEEWCNNEGQAEYLFFIHNADEATLVRLAADLAQLPGVPTGVYAVVNTSAGPMGAGRRVALT